MIWVDRYHWLPNEGEIVDIKIALLRTQGWEEMVRPGYWKLWFDQGGAEIIWYSEGGVEVKTPFQWRRRDKHA